MSRTRPFPVSAPAPPLTLAAADLEFDGGGDRVLRLTFDRAIDVADLDGSQITVEDTAETGFIFAGTVAVALPTPQSVVVGLTPTGSAEGPTDVTATASTGIVAADDGGTWAGVTDLELPFP